MTIARLGCGVGDFYGFTPAELYYAVEAKVEFERKESEYRYKISYEIARFIVTAIWNAKGRFFKTMKKEREIVQFPWEKEEIKIQSTEEMKVEMERIAAMFRSKERRKTRKRKR